MVVDLGSVKFGLAFSLGTATFFAPCAYPLLPGYVAFFLGREADQTPPLWVRLRRAIAVGVLTSLGFFLVYGLLTGVAVWVGTSVLGNVTVLELVSGLVLVGLGSAMATGVYSPGDIHVRLPERKRTPAGFFVFGVVYAAAAAGCTAPLFIAVITTGISAGPVAAIGTLAAYAGGMSALMIGVTLLSALGRDTVLDRIPALTGRISRVAGLVIVGAGLLQVYFFVVVFDGLRYFRF